EREGGDVCSPRDQIINAADQVRDHDRLQVFDRKSAGGAHGIDGLFDDLLAGEAISHAVALHVLNSFDRRVVAYEQADLNRKDHRDGSQIVIVSCVKGTDAMKVVVKLKRVR